MKKLMDGKALELLRDAMHPPEAGEGPQTDLWPRVRRRLDQKASSPPAADWVLAVVLGLLCLLRPSVVGILLLHF
jgi:hypothetical protein